MKRKTLSRGKKLLLAALGGLGLGAGGAALLMLRVLRFSADPSEICFWGGIILLVLGLLSMLRGNPNMGGSDGTGFGLNAQARLAMDEAKLTESRGGGYLRNHVMELNLFGVFCFPMGLALLLGGVLPVLLSGGLGG